MIEFGQLLADLPTLKNGGATKVDNVIPLAKGYKSIPGFTALSGTGLTGTPVGLFTSFSATGTTNYEVMMVNYIKWIVHLSFKIKVKQVDITDQQQQEAEIFGASHNLEQTY